jgi:hypothetical protein
MSAMLILIAILLGLQVAGLLGALVAIPVAGCIMVILRDAMQSRRVTAMAEIGHKDFDPENDTADDPVVFTENKFVKPKHHTAARRKSHKE